MMVSCVSSLMETGLGIKDKQLLNKLASKCGDDNLKVLEDYLNEEDNKSVEDLTHVIEAHYATSEDIISKSQCRTFVMRIKYLSDWFSLMKGGTGSIDCWTDFSRTRFISFYRQVQVLETVSSDDDVEEVNDDDNDNDDGDVSVVSNRSTYSYHTSPKPWRLSKSISSPRLGRTRKFGSPPTSPTSTYPWARSSSFKIRYRPSEEQGPRLSGGSRAYPDDESEKAMPSGEQPVSLADTSVTYQSLTPDSKLSPQGSTAGSDEEASQEDLDTYKETHISEGPVFVLHKHESFPEDEVTLASDFSV